MAAIALIAGAGLAPAGAYGHGVAPDVTGLTNNGGLSFTATWSKDAGKPTRWGYGVYDGSSIFSLASGNGRVSATMSRAGTYDFTVSQCPVGGYVEFVVSNRIGRDTIRANC